MSYSVLAVLTGRVQPFRGADEPSAIGKRAVAGPRKVDLLGIEGDEQADLRFHGGPDKAIHHYPFDHYTFWQTRLNGHPLLGTAGGFGENISTLGLTEGEICLGDRFRLGTALVEVSQGRQPCWKQGHRLDDAVVPAVMVKTRRSGWYYRVIEPGEVGAGDQLTLMERPLPEWSVARVFGLLIGGEGKRDPAALRALAGLEVLAQSWQERVQDLLG